MKQVYGYLRVSTVKQGEGVSLIEQREAISRYAGQYHLEVVRWFEEKETAAKQGRPLFNAMMKLLKARKAVGVIMHKIDRSARNLKDWADLGNLIDDGVEVHFAHESLDLQARGGRLSADIQAVIAADYIRNLRQEAIKGLYGRLKQGFYPFQAPIGYLNAGKGKAKPIDPVKAPLVQQAFQLYATGNYSLDTLCNELYRLGLRNTWGNKVNQNSLSLVLRNPFYIGLLEVKGATFKGCHEPLISHELFHQVQRTLKGFSNTKVITHRFRFRKMITCALCKFSLIAETQKGHVYYRCHTKTCLTKCIRETAISNMIEREFSLVQLQPEEARQMEVLLRDTESDWQDKEQELLAALKLQTSQIKSRVERLTDCYVEGGLDRPTYESRKTKLLFELAAKEEKSKEFSGGNQVLLQKMSKFLELAKSLADTYKTANSEEQRHLVEITTSNLEVSEKNLTMTMHIPFTFLVKRDEPPSGPPDRDEPRKMQGKIDSSDINSPRLQRKPLSKTQLRLLFDSILAEISSLPENNSTINHAIQTNHSSP